MCGRVRSGVHLEMGISSLIASEPEEAQTKNQAKALEYLSGSG